MRWCELRKEQFSVKGVYVNRVEKFVVCIKSMDGADSFIVSEADQPR